MENGRLALTAVYLKLDAEYFGFIEELPAMNSRGRNLDEARSALQSLAAEVFAEERRTVAEAHSACSVVREAFYLPAAARKAA
jgi:predicted RNase H-like HicB family nuclease